VAMLEQVVLARTLEDPVAMPVAALARTLEQVATLQLEVLVVTLEELTRILELQECLVLDPILKVHPDHQVVVVVEVLPLEAHLEPVVAVVVEVLPLEDHLEPLLAIHQEEEELLSLLH
jgi:hypothetical protein